MQMIETVLANSAIPSGQLKVQIRPLESASDAIAFRTLNEEWIVRHFALEEKDCDTLGDPERTILGKGGAIFMAFVATEQEAIGCVALIPTGGGMYELSKMAVAPHLRGHGIGRVLIEHTIAQARVLGAKSLFLGSNSKLPAAVRLYESVGFRHVPKERLSPMGYARADVFMEMPLS